MPSGYVTSDGKDLDTRYLGINDKAKSAETADSASSMAVALNIKPLPYITLSKTVGPHATYQWPITCYGLVVSGARSLTVDGLNMYNTGETVFVTPTSVVTSYNSAGNANSTYTIVIQPFSVQ